MDWIDGLTLGDRHVWPLTLFDEIAQAGHGIDINDNYGGLTQWNIQWRAALSKAQQIGSPGVVVDLEHYLVGELGYTTAFALSGVTRQELEDGLRIIGGQMVDVANDVYPTAKILDLYGAISPLGNNGANYYTDFSVYYVARGMLDRMVEIGSELAYLAGGECDIGYMHASMTAANAKIQTSETNNAALLAAYPHVQLSAPFFPYNGYAATSGWVQTWLDANGVGFPTIADTHPLLDAIRDYTNDGTIWVYGEPSCGYEPFNASTGAPILGLLRYAKCRDSVAALGSEPTVYDTKAALGRLDDDMADGRYLRQSDI
jgi:hypothetical protein